MTTKVFHRLKGIGKDISTYSDKQMLKLEAKEKVLECVATHSTNKNWYNFYIGWATYTFYYRKVSLKKENVSRETL